jgi:AcrR family transcriptional regulator
MSTAAEFAVSPDLVAAAIRAADRCGRDVADVPLTTIAQVAGVSRSTLLRRLHGSRRALDEAVRAAGVDPGGQPVRVRAVEAGARLVSERGPATVTLEAVAEAAGCSVHSLYAIFGTRDKLFAAIYERYSPLADLAGLWTDSDGSLEQTVADFYRTLAVSLTREPRVATAMLADLLGNPNGPTAPIFARYFPRAVSIVGGWLESQIQAGRIREIPVLLLMQLLIGPLLAHLLVPPATTREAEWDLPELEQACSVFTSTFLRAVTTPAPDGETAFDCKSPHPDNDAEGG